MTLDLAVPSQLLLALTPDLIVAGGAMLLLLFAVWRPEDDAHARHIAIGGMLVCVAALASIGWMATLGVSAPGGIIAVDNYRWAVDAVVLIGALMTIAVTSDYHRRTLIIAGESQVLVLLATSGMMLLAASSDLMMIFLGVEVMSISAYALTAIDRRSARSAEAGLKYFLLGAFSSAFLLYGIALVYGATGTTNLAEMARRLLEPAAAGSGMLLVGIALLVIGFGFKVAAVPFHMWTPDVYDGAPTPFSGFMATAVKAAGFAAFLRVFVEGLGVVQPRWHLVLWWLAAITMVAGNLVALAQRNVKRMLAYSSIAHAGYLLIAIVVGTEGGASAMLFYLLAYTLATIGAFAVVTTMGNPGNESARMEDYAGLWTVRPRMAMAMAVFMLALLGFPIAGGMGFFAKWYVLQAALQAPAPQTRLAILLVLTSVLSAGYYLYLIMVMFMRSRPADAAPLGPMRPMTSAVIGAAVLVLLAFGVYPTPIVRMARQSTPPMTTTASGAALATPSAPATAAIPAVAAAGAAALDH
ncbi:MAG TPA: NADH-quinone oxidoreductase subunit N [Gemmatimonadaceae bacterium]|jgi:NADH-quinone oxidoreductase subunit N|nr:NADH-quinone oxidoreductase subunit N [Gemmatimonadaceae bacterium]